MLQGNYEQIKFKCIEINFKKKGGTIKIIGHGKSMGNLVRDDCKLQLTTFYKKLHIGDIIVFQNRNDLIVHRIINIKYTKPNTLYLTKGDAKPYWDGYISEELILGKVIQINYGLQFIELNILWNKLLSKAISYMSLCEGHINNSLNQPNIFNIKYIIAKTIIMIVSFFNFPKITQITRVLKYHVCN